MNFFTNETYLVCSQIARNRLGLNDGAHEVAKADAEKERLKKEKEQEKAKAAKKNGTP
jgi:hypothetical protein